MPMIYDKETSLKLKIQRLHANGFITDEQYDTFCDMMRDAGEYNRMIQETLDGNN